VDKKELLNQPKIFKKNLAAFSLNFPAINWPALKPNAKAQLNASKNGQINFLIANKAVHSTYNPSNEAVKQLESFDDEADSFVVLGFGLAYIVDELLKKTETKKIFIAEGDLELFCWLLQHKDFTPYLNNKQIIFLFNHNNTELEELWHNHSIQQPQIIINRALYDNHAYLAQVDKALVNYLSKTATNRITLKKNGRLWLRNLAANSRLLSKAGSIKEAFGRFNYPTTLVAAGVSLENILPYFKEIYERSLIVVVDTAYRVLLKHGFEADFVVASDSSYWNSRHLDGCGGHQGILVGELGLYPTVYRQNFKLLLCQSFFPLARFFEQPLVDNGHLLSGGSVATTAFNLCRQLGTSSIYLTGLDLAFTSPKPHARSCRFEEWAVADSNRLKPLNNFLYAMSHSANSLYVKANNGGLVRTDERMELYRRWFSQQAAEVAIYNLSDGVAIGSPASLEQLLALPPIRPQIEADLAKLPLLAAQSTELALKIKIRQNYFADVFTALANFALQFKEALEKGVTITELQNKLTSLQSDEMLNLLFAHEFTGLADNPTGQLAGQLAATSHNYAQLFSRSYH